MHQTVIPPPPQVEKSKLSGTSLRIRMTKVMTMAGWRISRCGVRYSLDRNLSPRYLARYQDANHIKCLPSQAVSFPKKGMANNGMAPTTQCAPKYSCVPPLAHQSKKRPFLIGEQRDTAMSHQRHDRPILAIPPRGGRGYLKETKGKKMHTQNAAASSLSQARTGRDAPRQGSGDKDGRGATCNSRPAAGSA